MAVTVVIGGQYGGEGKGKIVAHLAKRDKPDFVVRCGGPNSGHTVYFNDQIYKLRMLPAGFVNDSSRLLLAAGSLVNLNILREEIRIAGIDESRVGIDRNAAIISSNDEIKEFELGLRNSIGSTLSGTGIGVANRALRNGSIKLASDIPEAYPFITDVSAEINDGIDKGKTCIVEGTQGFGLSLYHTECYPYATSRDTTASAFLSEVGLSPLTVKCIIMAIRTFPIRVEGSSGPLKNETTWETIRQTSGYPYEIGEYSTVTNKLRRVGEFDLDLVKRAVMVNKPNELAVHGVDYISYSNKGLKKFTTLSNKTKIFIDHIENTLNTPVFYIGTGPHSQEIVDRKIGLIYNSSNDFVNSLKP